MRPVKKINHWVVMLLVLAVWAVHIHVLHSIIRFSYTVAWQDGACSTIILCGSVWGIVLLIRRYPTTAIIYFYALFIAFIGSLLGTLGLYETLKWWIVDSEKVYRPWLGHTLPIRFLGLWIINSWMATNSALRKNIAALDTRFQLKTDASVLLKEAELFKLRQQLQPHFLYNSLNSISALIIMAPDKAQEMIGKLSDFLRSSVNRESEDMIAVDEELSYIQSYLDIESVRFGDRLQVHIENDGAGNAAIPPFLLQPILENAIKFGLYGNTGTVNIAILLELEGAMLTISITNPYDADNAPPRGTGFGLEGIQRRLYLVYARAGLLETKKDGGNFTTTIHIPQPHV